MLSWFLKMRLKTKVGLSFLLVTLILLVVIIVIIQMIKELEGVTQRVIKMRTPTTQASHMMLNGMNHSLASLRAWIILGEDQFKLERQIAWSQQIEPSMKKMLDLSREWTEPHNIELLNDIKANVETFRRYQEEIERIAHTEENTPAKKILFGQVAPLERSVLNHLNKLIRLELKQKPSSKRKGLVALLNDLEIVVGLTLEKVEEYLLSGTELFKVQFEHHWDRQRKLFNKLREKSSLFSPRQKAVLQRLLELHDEMVPLLKKIVAIRSSDQWNQAHYKLKTQAAPLAASITHSLNEMIASQNALLENDLEEVSRRTHWLIVILVGWFIAGGLLSGVLGSAITRGLTHPILSMDRTLQELARGNFRQDPIPTISEDELGQLVRHTNLLVERLRTFRRHAENLLAGNLKVQEFDLEGDFKNILDNILQLVKNRKPPVSGEGS